MKMFDNLSENLKEIIKKASGNSHLTEENITDALREIRRSLLDADVNLKVVKAFISNVKDRAIGEKVISSVDPSSMLIKIVNDEIKNILGKENTPLNLKSKPSIIMMLGLQGSGKTTTAAKLSLKLKKEGKKVLLVGCDVYRPAAIKQLEILSKSTQSDFFAIDNCQNVKKIVEDSITYAKNNASDVIILDTAGRLQIDSEMMAELMLIDKSFEIDEKLLVIDSMIGQEAVNVASDFKEQIGITGIILTKLDGDTKGGAALSVVYCTNTPIKFTGMGEKIEALDDFYPDRMASRILGMGDVVSLVEKAKEVFDEKESLKLQEKMKTANFSFNDFLKMQKQISKLGSIGNILSLLPIPGLNSEMRDSISNMGEKQFKKIESIINSMTKKERENPELINSSRKKRIAYGCGLNINEINLFINQFNTMRKMLSGFSGYGGKYKGKNKKMHPNLLKNIFK